MGIFTQSKFAVVAAALVGMSTFANAIPTLQLGIAGGTYNLATETSDAQSSIFSLYAYLKEDATNLIADQYFVSMAVTPKLGPIGATLGSFTVNGATVNVTADMVYGTPPLDAVLSDGSLGSHSIFETYFYEKSFFFDALNQSLPFNTEFIDDSGPLAGAGMYFKKFDIDVTNLDKKYAIHFDLYNTKLITCKLKDNACVPGNLDVTQFAPFSHDAQSGPGGGGPSNETPEPAPMFLLGLGLLGMAWMRRKT